MNWIDTGIILVVIVLFIFAIRAIRNNGSCSGECSNCSGSCKNTAHCHKKSKDGVPAFVEAYRRDHPKKPNVL